MAGGPWEITLRQFMARAKREYGVEARAALQVGVYGLFLAEGERSMAIPAVEEDDILTPAVLEGLCAYFGIPPLDFGLDPEPED